MRYGTECGPGAFEHLEHEFAHAEHVVHVGAANGALASLQARAHQLLVAPLRVVIRVVLRAHQSHIGIGIAFAIE